MLTGNARIAWVDRSAKTVAMAGHAIALGHQGGGSTGCSRCSGQGGSAFHHTVGGIERRQIGHVLIAQRGRNTAHGRMLAIALFIGIQCADDVLGTLTGDHGHLVHLGKTGLVTDDAVATNAHGIFLGARLGVALHFLRLRRHQGDTRDKRGGYEREGFVHFARTIQE